MSPSAPVFNYAGVEVVSKRWSHYGICRCQKCGFLNRFRSDFTYMVGDAVSDHICLSPTCDRDRHWQTVVTLTDHEFNPLPPPPLDTTRQEVLEQQESKTMDQQTRNDVYAAINGERDYQEARWVHGHNHSIGDWLCYLKTYIGKAETAVTFFDGTPGDGADPRHVLRKIAALGVAAMEDVGVVQRIGYEGQRFQVLPVLEQPVKAQRYGQEVFEVPGLDGARKTECLCHRCARMNPGAADHCEIANRFYKVCQDSGCAFILTRCGSWKARE